MQHEPGYGGGRDRSIRLDLPLILPEIGDLQDACIGRLIQLLQGGDGVARVHVAQAGTTDREPGAEPQAVGEAQLCLHYDPERLTLAQITALAEAAGAEITDQFGQAEIPFHLVGTENDCHPIAQRGQDSLSARL